MSDEAQMGGFPNGEAIPATGRHPTSWTQRAVEATLRPDHVLVGSGHERGIRWREGERLEQLFEQTCDRLRDSGQSGHLAVDGDDAVLTYDELDTRANRLARYLVTRGAGPGDRIGLLFDQPVYTYVGLLAVLKINAAYVPLDIGFPPDRLAYIVQDSGVQVVVSLSHLSERLQGAGTAVLCLDQIAALIDDSDDRRLTDAEKGNPVDELCYIVYTSGSTGLPKGVAIRHAAICNFVRVAVEVYGLSAQDRIYQGMTIAFDFSCEEIWVPLVAGATLVPKPDGSALLAAELWEFLSTNNVTALCCVPTLLATLEEDLPGLRFLLVSGEPCPQDLVARWHRPGRRFLNVYGPTEATVTATWTEVHPDRPVTIGVPLPTYAAVILDPVENQALPPGEVGEIGIAGIGLASGYVNRNDLTDQAFIRDFLGIEHNPSGRIYRTGDLGRVNGDGEIEYHGRIDAQIKIRGYRVDPTEIESILWQLPGITHAVVDTFEAEPGNVELVAFYSVRNGGAGTNPSADQGVDVRHVYAELRRRLPGYMVPAYLEELASIPMLPSGKVDRPKLPVPKRPRRVAARHGYLAPATATERILADALADVIGLDQVSVDSHFFDELGANSLLMARFCGRVREWAELPPVSMRDIYQHPTIRSLAGVLADAAVRATTDMAAPSARPQALEAMTAPARTSQYVRCGVLQLLGFLAVLYLGTSVVVVGYDWTSDATGVVDLYLRAVVFSSTTFLYSCTLPVLAKWTLVGRWKTRQIRVWSLAYVRFWFVKTLIQTSPMVLFTGSPLYVLYLRLLGAKVGKGVVIFAKFPVCADLLTIGSRTVIRENCSVLGYRADAGVIRTGPITLGDDVFVGEKTVLDINTAMGEGAQLGHASTLYASQAVPAGERWHGCPAQRTDTNYLTVAPARCGTVRRVAYGVTQLVNLLVVFGPLGTVGTVTLLNKYPILDRVTDPRPGDFTHWAFYRDALVISVVLFLAGVLGGLVLVVSVPRLLHIAVKPDRIYPLYGLQYWAQRTIIRVTNVKFFHKLFGDSSYIVHYLRALGYSFTPPIVQTGTNFGTQLRHASPYLTTVGSGTMISDGLLIMNVDYSSTSFRASRVTIGAGNYLGNEIAYPVGARTGDNVLLGTKVAVPIEGERVQNIGLLGSPCFKIPRSVQRDHTFDQLKRGGELHRRLIAKNHYNIATMGIFLLVSYVKLVMVTLLALGAMDLVQGRGAPVVVMADLIAILFVITFGMMAERAVTRFRSLNPRLCSIYEPYFWWHERLWKLSALAPFKGTPFRNVIWRLLGVRIGRRVFDDGCEMTERTLVTIGDDCTLNAGSVIQCHSLEEGVFKSDRTTIDAGCTLGVAAFVHYGVTMGEGTALDANSFLMKGQEVPPHTRWRGNPATETSASHRIASRSAGTEAHEAN